MRRLFLVMAMAVLSMGHSCVTMGEADPPPSVTKQIIQETVCVNIKVLDFVYEPGDPENSDTIGTIKGLRSNNAAIVALCEPGDQDEKGP